MSGHESQARVQDVSLRDGDALVTFLVRVRSTSDTTAHIRTGTLLGERVLTLGRRQHHDEAADPHPDPRTVARIR